MATKKKKGMNKERNLKKHQKRVRSKVLVALLLLLLQNLTTMNMFTSMEFRAKDTT
ncbi:LOW QUALITY PROTEIN: hypothetical protein TorRG33x02_178640 [Trema orientale]|uniref:Uncharacterized protein n=1 Tax=Trema orientale TaxID=63057 RepID=A0A2P5EL64_TREOI|nr:LOW QUALITY PROTEIN: hypothetical protein TorRG33x02_178640 [Trema orientale]